MQTNSFKCLIFLHFYIVINLGTQYVSKSGALGFIQTDSSQEDKAMQEKIMKALKDN